MTAVAEEIPRTVSSEGVFRFLALEKLDELGWVDDLDYRYPRELFATSQTQVLIPLVLIVSIPFG